MPFSKCKIDQKHVTSTPHTLPGAQTRPEQNHSLRCPAGQPLNRNNNWWLIRKLNGLTCEWICIWCEEGLAWTEQSRPSTLSWYTLARAIGTARGAALFLVVGCWSWWRAALLTFLLLVRNLWHLTFTSRFCSDHGFEVKCAKKLDRAHNMSQSHWLAVKNIQKPIGKAWSSWSLLWPRRAWAMANNLRSGGCPSGSTVDRRSRSNKASGPDTDETYGNYHNICWGFQYFPKARDRSQTNLYGILKGPTQRSQWPFGPRTFKYRAASKRPSWRWSSACQSFLRTSKVSKSIHNIFKLFQNISNL